MVFQRERGAKESHDAVAGHLVHRPFKAVNGIHHLEKDGVEKRVRFLRVPARDEFHRSLEIGKQDGDQLALALEGCAAGEDALGEMRRCIGISG